MSEKRRCQGVSGQGEPCKAPPMKGSGYCYFHNPETLEQRRAIGGNTRRGPDKKPVRQSGALDGVVEIFSDGDQAVVAEDGQVVILHSLDNRLG